MMPWEVCKDFCYNFLFFPPDIEIEFRFADILVADTMESACLRYNINNQS